MTLQVSQSARVSSILDGPDLNSTLGSLFQYQQQASIMLGAGPCGIDFRSMGTGMDTHLRRSFSNPISSVLSGMTAVDAFDDNVSQVSLPSTSSSELPKFINMRRKNFLFGLSLDFFHALKCKSGVFKGWFCLSSAVCWMGWRAAKHSEPHGIKPPRPIWIITSWKPSL